MRLRKPDSSYLFSEYKTNFISDIQTIQVLDPRACFMFRKQQSINQ